MKDPVVLSSGVVVNRSTAYKKCNWSSGLIIRDYCPLTHEKIDKEVYTVKYIRAQIIDWTK